MTPMSSSDRASPTRLTRTTNAATHFRNIGCSLWLERVLVGAARTPLPADHYPMYLRLGWRLAGPFQMLEITMAAAGPRRYAEPAREAAATFTGFTMRHHRSSKLLALIAAIAVAGYAGAR